MSCIKSIDDLRIYRDEHGLNKGKWNGYDADPLTDELLDTAKKVEPYIPKDFELFPCGDSSVQWESKISTDDWECIEVYENKFYYTGPEHKDSIEFKDINEFIEFLKGKYHVES